MADEHADSSLPVDALQKLDAEILALINRRAEMVVQQAKESQSVDPMARMDAAGSSYDLDELIATYEGPLPENSIRVILRELVSGCRVLLKPQRIAYLGPRYSFSYLAAVHRFGESVELVPVPTISSVFEEVSGGHSDFGLVPIENSTDGRIVDTLHHFARHPIPICGEVQLRIHHNLLGKGPRENIQRVCSKPQALSQCREWLARHLPHATLENSPSTTDAAKRASEEEGTAAVASLVAGRHYGLDAIAANIEDNPDNVTRFAVIGNEVSPASGQDKTTLMFEVTHEPGSLADTMLIFKRCGLNMTWIESFPKPNSSNEYLFFVSLEGHFGDLGVATALQSLRAKTRRLEVLGSYAQSEPTG